MGIIAIALGWLAASAIAALLRRRGHADAASTTLFIGADGRLRETRIGPLSRATLEQHLLRITPTSDRSIPAP